jgi:flagella basal body P-ring formation protein FlgA
MRLGCTALIGLMISLPVLGAGPSTVLSFKSASRPRADARYLSVEDILSIDGGDSGCQQRLGAIRIDAADRNSQEVLSNRDVEAAIARSGIAGDCPVQWHGTTLVRLTVPRALVDLPDLRADAAERLRTVLTGVYQDVVVEPLPAASRVPNGVAPGTHFQVIEPAIDRVSRRMVVEVRVEEPGRKPWRLPLWFSVSAKRAALLASRDIASRQDLGSIPLRAEMIDWAALDGLAIPGDFDLKGYVANHDIAAGSVIRTGDVSLRPDVVAGDAVSVHVSAGAIRLETMAVALQSGSIGDRILIRNTRGQGDLTARVDRPGDVEVAP